jgi:DNA-binding NtrC family response regulator
MHRDVALILCNPDVIDLVAYLLARRNMTYVGLDPWAGIDSMQRLILRQRPACVVLDLIPDYRSSGQYALRLMKLYPESKFIFTAADPQVALARLPWLKGYATFQKPFDPILLADLITSMSHKRALAAAARFAADRERQTNLMRTAY